VRSVDVETIQSCCRGPALSPVSALRSAPCLDRLSPFYIRLTPTFQQFAIAQGAKAIITSSSDEKLATVVEHITNSRHHGGAGELVTHNYKKDPNWDEKVMRETQEGADHILEVGRIQGIWREAQHLTGWRFGNCREMCVPATGREGSLTLLAAFKAIRRGGVISECVLDAVCYRFHTDINFSIGFLASNPDQPPPNLSMLVLFKTCVSFYIHSPPLHSPSLLCATPGSPLIYPAPSSAVSSVEIVVNSKACVRQ